LLKLRDRKEGKQDLARRVERKRRKEAAAMKYNKKLGLKSPGCGREKSERGSTIGVKFKKGREVENAERPVKKGKKGGVGGRKDRPRANKKYWGKKRVGETLEGELEPMKIKGEWGGNRKRL